MDKRSVIKFPEYSFLEQDIALAETIKGLKKIGQVNPKPFQPYFYYEVDDNISSDNFNDFLDSLPKEFAFEFSKSLDSINAVPSTSIIVQEQDNKYFYYCFSHGQSNVWNYAARSEILQLLMINKKFQYRQSFKTYRATKTPVENQKAF